MFEKIKKLGELELFTNSNCIMLTFSNQQQLYSANLFKPTAIVLC